MRRYETIVILDPDLSEDQWESVLERVADLVSQLEGLLVAFDKWGTRKLAYEVKKKNRGYYVRLDYCGLGHLVDEIERFFRIDDRVLKYMTILTAETVEIDQIKEEIAQAEAAKQTSTQEAEPVDEPIPSEVSEAKTSETETDPTEDTREV